MSSRDSRTNERERKRLLELCGELAFDDGIDPRHERRGSSRKKQDRKVFQLCRQVAETVALTLAGSQDAALRAVQVVRVEPAPDASRLRIVVTVPDAALDRSADDSPSPEEIDGALARVAGLLRAEVAAAITRRRTPELEITRIPAELADAPDSVEPDVEGRDS